MADRVPLDFDQPVRQLRSLLLGLDENELAAPTPCHDWSVAALLVHIVGFASAYTQAARKSVGTPGTDEPPPEPEPAELPVHWRSRLPVLLEDMATAWREPTAWTGTARVGGATLPAATIGAFGMNELVMHSWDLAKASGQDYAVDPRILEALIELLDQAPAGSFGTPVVLPDEESLLDQAVARAGRDPDWRPRKPG